MRCSKRLRCLDMIYEKNIYDFYQKSATIILSVSDLVCTICILKDLHITPRYFAFKVYWLDWIFNRFKWFIGIVL